MPWNAIFVPDHFFYFIFIVFSSWTCSMTPVKPSYRSDSNSYFDRLSQVKAFPPLLSPPFSFTLSIPSVLFLLLAAEVAIVTVVLAHALTVSWTSSILSLSLSVTLFSTGLPGSQTALPESHYHFL